MRSYDLFIYLLVVPILLSGCALLGGTGDAAQHVAARMATQGVVARYVRERPDETRQRSADTIIDAAAILARIVDNRATVTINDLERTARDAIPWDRLYQEEQRAALEILTFLGEQLRARVGEGDLDGDARMAARSFFEWIIGGVKMGLIPRACRAGEVCA